MENYSTQREIEDEFVRVAKALYNYFPDLDLRFNLRSDSTQARCLIPSAKKKSVCLKLGRAVEETVREAVWEIKVATSRFDD